MHSHRITIWGNSGSGKSTLSERLGQELGVPTFHVDHIAWLPGWRYQEEAVFIEQQRRWLSEPSWIIDGVGYLSGMIERFQAADLIIMLKTPIELCRARAQRRLDLDAVSPDRFMASGCRYGEVVEKQWEVIDYFDQTLLPEIERVLQSEFSAKAQLQLDGSLSLDELCIGVTKCLTKR